TTAGIISLLAPFLEPALGALGLLDVDYRALLRDGFEDYVGKALKKKGSFSQNVQAKKLPAQFADLGGAFNVISKAAVASFGNIGLNRLDLGPEFSKVLQGNFQQFGFDEDKAQKALLRLSRYMGGMFGVITEFNKFSDREAQERGNRPF